MHQKYLDRTKIYQFQLNFGNEWKYLENLADEKNIKSTQLIKYQREQHHNLKL